MSAYVSSTRVEERIAKCASLNVDASCVPVVVEGVQGGKAHFSVLPREATVAQLARAVRGFDGVDAKKAVSLLVAECVAAPTTTLGELHDACKQADDGMLYFCYAQEAAMGGFANFCGWNTGKVLPDSFYFFTSEPNSFLFPIFLFSEWMQDSRHSPTKLFPVINQPTCSRRVRQCRRRSDIELQLVVGGVERNPGPSTWDTLYSTLAAPVSVPPVKDLTTQIEELKQVVLTLAAGMARTATPLPPPVAPTPSAFAPPPGYAMVPVSQLPTSPQQPSAMWADRLRQSAPTPASHQQTQAPQNPPKAPVATPGTQTGGATQLKKKKPKPGEQGKKADPAPPRPKDLLLRRDLDDRTAAYLRHWLECTAAMLQAGELRRVQSRLFFLHQSVLNRPTSMAAKAVPEGVAISLLQYHTVSQLRHALRVLAAPLNSNTTPNKNVLFGVSQQTKQPKGGTEASSAKQNVTTAATSKSDNKTKPASPAPPPKSPRIITPKSATKALATPLTPPIPAPPAPSQVAVEKTSAPSAALQPEHTKEIQELRTQLTARDKELNRVTEALTKAKTGESDRAKALEDLIAETSSLKDSFAKQKEELQRLRTEKTALQHTKESAAEELATLRSSSEAQQKTVERLTQELAQAQSAVRRSQEERQAKEVTIRGLEQQVASFRKNDTSATQQHDSLHAQLIQAQAENDLLKQSVDEKEREKTRLDTELRQSQSSRSLAAQQLDTARAELVKCQNRQALAQTHITNQHAEIETQSTEIERLRGELQLLSTQQQLAEQTNADLMRKLEETEQRHRQHTAQIQEEFTNHLTTLVCTDEEAADSAREARTLAQQLTMATMEIQKLQGELGASRARGTRLEEELEEFNRAIAQLQHNLASSQSEATNSASQVHDLLLQSHLLQDRLKQVTSETPLSMQQVIGSALIFIPLAVRFLQGTMTADEDFVKRAYTHLLTIVDRVNQKLTPAQRMVGQTFLHEVLSQHPIEPVSKYPCSLAQLTGPEWPVQQLLNTPSPIQYFNKVTRRAFHKAITAVSPAAQSSEAMPLRASENHPPASLVGKKPLPTEGVVAKRLRKDAAESTPETVELETPVTPPTTTTPQTQEGPLAPIQMGTVVVEEIP